MVLIRPERPGRSHGHLAALLVPMIALAGCGGTEGQASEDTGSDGTLGEPNAVFPEDFGAIQTVRELADGTVLVADPLGNALYRVDLDAGTRTQVGQEGQGPQEYRQPDAVWPLPGDSTLLVDLGNGRMIALGPDLAFGPTAPLSTGDPRTGLVVAIPRGVDAQGRVYSQSMGGGMRGQPPDSGAVLRIERGTFAVDTVTRYKLQETVRQESGGAGNRMVMMQQVPLSPEDAWGVASDGTVVVARAGDYRVEWHAPDGTVTAGPPTPYDPLPIGMDDRQAWVDDQGRTGGGIGVSISINNGAIQTSFSRGGAGRGAPQEVDDYTWPETKPAFQGGRILVDPMGRAWVRRHVRAGEDATYDVFDRTGQRVDTITLPDERRVVAFGAASVYVVAYDEFDLNYLERYDLPR